MNKYNNRKLTKITTFLGILGFLLSLLSLLYLIYTNFSNYIISLIIGLLGGLLGFVFSYLVFILVKNLRPKFDFKIRKKEVIYEYRERNEMIYTKKVQLIALRDNLDKYIDRYKWSGASENIQVQSIDKEQTVVPTKDLDGWAFYEIHFGRHLKKREQIDTTLVWTLLDKQCVAKPYFSCTIEEPTDELIMTLILPKFLVVNEVWCEVTSHYGAKVPLYCEKRSIDNNIATWKIENPKMLYHYNIWWEFPEDISFNKNLPG